MPEKKSLIKIIFQVIKKRFKLWHLLIFALIISVNTFAWFIYMNKVSSDLTVKVKSWNVSFKFDNQTMTDYVNFDASTVYPGMTPINQSLTVSNDGEVDARLSYEVVYANIFGEVFDTENGTITSQQLTNKLANDYPFKINLSSSSNVLHQGGANEHFDVELTWDFETEDDSGNLQDDVDTYWGKRAYDYQLTTNSPCIQIVIKLSAIQIN